MTNEEKLYQIFPDGICPFSKVWLSEEYREPTTKNDLGIDCISRADAIKAMQNKAKKLKNEDTINGLCGAVAILYELPPATPQLSVPEVTALAEWTTKLTKECEEAYNKGYADGRKEQESRWISVSERLPEDRREVLVTAYWHETYQVMMASYFGDGLWWCVPFNNCGEHMQRLKPKAWMPLPKAYSEVEE